MKRSSILVLALIILFAVGTLQSAFALDVSGPTQTFGFQNGSYIGFADATSFVTSVDGGGTQLIPSSNASYPDFMFFQVQGSTDVYGFWASGCNITVTNYFVGDNNNLQFITDGSGVVKVYVENLGLPTIITAGTSGSFDSALHVASLTVVGAVSVRLNFGGGDSDGGLSNPSPTPTPGGSGGGQSTPTPVVPTPTPYGTTPTPIPSSTPTTTLGANDFQVSNLDFGTIKPNSTVMVNLHFSFSSSSYNLQTISLPEPFNSWYVQNDNFTYLVYMLNTSGDSSGDVVLTFLVGNVTGSASDSFSVTALDAFGTTHTSFGTISVVVSDNSRFDVIVFFQIHPLYLILIAVAILVIVIVLSAFTKRKH